jgi:phasin
MLLESKFRIEARAPAAFPACWSRLLIPPVAGAAEDIFMLNLWIRTFLWAAWWPLSTWLLMLQKAAAKGQAVMPPPPAHGNQGQARGEESHMANDAFMKPEVPEQVREAMKMSIEQAKRAFETFAATSEQTWKSFESNTPSTPSLRSLTNKIAEITRSNAEANFVLALKLAESKDFGQALELQADYLRKQMDSFLRQLEEIRDLAVQVMQESTPPGIGGDAP